MPRADGPTRFGVLLRGYRLAAGLTQEALAELAGVGTRSVQGMEAGERHPRRETVRRLATALGLDAAERARLEAAAPAAPRRRAMTSIETRHATSRAEPFIPALPQHNLPAQLTSFIGREPELAEIARLLQTARLLTLTGAGGCGKTRLALHVATDLVGRYPDGVWFVDLAPVADPTLVPRAVAVALGVHEMSGCPLLATLCDHLREQDLLLVLDNCEHLLDACARLADALLRAGPRLHLLATSRERLGLEGEVSWRVPSLSIPPPDSGTPGHPDAATEISPSGRPSIPGPRQGGVADFEAMRLFVDRARAVRPDFPVTDRNARAVAQICRRLDGIPLAIELAAARVRVLPVEQIAARLDDRFRLLTGGSRTAPPRHRGLQAAIDWSHGLLTEPERVLFRRLAVFAGGWSLGAAEAVCAGAGLEAGDVLDLLTGLIDKSMVIAELQGGQERHRFLETIRQYGDEKLRGAGELVALRDRHRDWWAAQAARAAAAWFGPRWGEQVDQLQREQDNLRAALRWCRESSPERGLALAADLAWFWAFGSFHGEAVAWLEEFLDLALARTATRARALLGLEHIVRVWGADEARAWTLSREALSIAREVGDDGLTSDALSRVGLNEANAGDYTAARASLEESLALERIRNEAMRLMTRLRDLGTVCVAAGDSARARALLRESLAVARATGSAAGAGMALLRLGALERVDGDLASARAWLEESRRLNAEARHAGGVFMAEAGLANLARCEGRWDEARAMLMDGLRRAGPRGNRAALLHQVCSLGILAVMAGEHARGTRLIAAFASPAGLVGNVHSPDLRVEGRRALMRARAALGETAFGAAWAAGQTMTVETAIADALGSNAPTVGSSGAAAPAPIAVLSTREWDVATLIAAGLTNRQIAERLVVSERTADAHVSHILAKLGLATRSQVAVWVATRAGGSPSAPSPRGDRLLSGKRR